MCVLLCCICCYAFPTYMGKPHMGKTIRASTIWASAHMGRAHRLLRVGPGPEPFPMKSVFPTENTFWKNWHALFEKMRVFLLFWRAWTFVSNSGSSKHRSFVSAIPNSGAMAIPKSSAKGAQSFTNSFTHMRHTESLFPHKVWWTAPGA